jgi:hypothetical protein
MWTIERVVSSKPYLRAYVSGHPNADKLGYVPLHRIVMENSIGRSLTSLEVVHHIDGNPLNNDISNLEIHTNSTHAKVHARGRTMVTLSCSYCGKEFEREVSQVNHKKKSGQKNFFCSRSCGVKSQYVKGLHSPRTKWAHGSRVGYNYHKCRCDLCRKAQREYMRTYSQKQAGLIKLA